jgi:hypothetical protein
MKEERKERRERGKRCGESEKKEGKRQRYL